MKYYVCSMANEGRGRPVELLTDNVGLLEKFAEDHDKAGRSVYSCPNPLMETAERRCKDAVAAIVVLHVDIDFKRLVTAPADVEAALLALPLRLEIRKTGGGFHVMAFLKEPYENGTEHYRRAEQLRSDLTRCLCGDPAPNHSAALLRVVGTHNSKYGEPVEVEIIKAGDRVDLTDIEAFLELYSQPLFETREEYNTAQKVLELDHYVPVDHDAVLADMPTTGEGVNAVSYRVMRSLVVREGKTPQEAMDITVDAIMTMAERQNLTDEDGVLWTREQEVKCAIPRMNWVLRCLEKRHWEAVDAGRISDDTPPDWLWAEAHEAWTVACNEGIRPQVSRNGNGWYVRRPPHSNKKADEEMKPADLGAAASPASTEALKKKPRAGITPFTAFDPMRLPAREWMYGRHYQRGTVSLTVGTRGRGRTSLVLVEVIAMALCKMLLGESPTARFRAWVHCGEDDMNELLRRVAAICQRYSLRMKDLEGWLFLTSANEFPLRVAEGYNELKIDNALIAHITAEIQANEIDLAVFDPFVTLHGSSENDAGKMSRVIDIFKKIASQTECAIELVHHTRKAPPGSNGDHDVSDMRGSSAIHDAARAVRVLNIMSEKEAEEFAIPTHERSLYVRVDRGKGNFAPPKKATWIHLCNVDLPNGDEVGVVEPWQHPGGGGPRTEASVARERAAEDMYMHLVARLIAAGRTLSDVPGKNYAPAIFAKEREARDARIGKAALEEAQRRLFAAGRIRVIEEGRGGRSKHRLEPT
jgi:hypothetical protein